MAFTRAFITLTFLSNFMLIHQHICDVELNKRIDDYNHRLLYFKVKVSLINIHPDGNGLRWCLTRDRMLRRYFGPCLNRSYALNFHCFKKHEDEFPAS